MEKKDKQTISREIPDNNNKETSSDKCDVSEKLIDILDDTICESCQ